MSRHALDGLFTGFEKSPVITLIFRIYLNIFKPVLLFPSLPGLPVGLMWDGCKKIFFFCEIKTWKIWSFLTAKHTYMPFYSYE